MNIKQAGDLNLSAGNQQPEENLRLEEIKVHHFTLDQLSVADTKRHSVLIRSL